QRDEAGTQHRRSPGPVTESAVDPRKSGDLRRTGGGDGPGYSPITGGGADSSGCQGLSWASRQSDLSTLAGSRSASSAGFVLSSGSITTHLRSRPKRNPPG